MQGGGGGAALHLTLHCHHHSDLCIKLDSDESQFTVAFIVRGKVTRQCPQTTKLPTLVPNLPVVVVGGGGGG